MKRLFQNDDAALWRLVQADDREAFQILYARYIDVIFIKVSQLVRNNADAEDIVQEVFIRIWEKRAVIQLEGRFFSYLFRSAQNKALNYFRDKKIPSDLLTAWETLPEDDQHPAEVPQTFLHREMQELESLFETEKSRLPYKMKQVYELRYEQKMSEEDISDYLIISIHTVRNHLKAVRKRLSDAIRRTVLPNR